ncbi:DUF2755 family protein [Entomohabitans teleogrylli]|uniref:DUF2755 family protein n=1 Tax=Entomohabitans teleogrylli TaxID=1384589 RepID=UPI0008FC96F1|nr:DUF2755 family protein [Entomohabitans teleogrylli]
MADLSIFKPVISGLKPEKAPAGNLTWAFFVLLCFWVGSWAVELLLKTPGLFERLLQNNAPSAPPVDIGWGVASLFGLVPFLSGSLVVGLVLLLARRRRR